ncbi:hypothetical protein P4H61_05880 [Paenibacillus peoriae]|uniref:hypothetical protein n=1 Tax=Paenibacillus peoriae TaxID=59893 RepID=UPI00026C5687|nr:hypothetical protein [Paenibacillus peoriae]MEC0181023.1 hypothetical protein [Paenibacillus peoriae]
MIENRRYDEFLKEIDKISKKIIEHDRLEYNVEEFKENFFRQSSHSPDNLESMAYIEYGVVRKKDMQNRKTFGLKVKDKDILISDIMFFLENQSVVSKCIQQEYPELTTAEIDAVLRVISISMMGLDCQQFGLEDDL